MISDLLREQQPGVKKKPASNRLFAQILPVSISPKVLRSPKRPRNFRLLLETFLRLSWIKSFCKIVFLKSTFLNFCLIGGLTILRILVSHCFLTYSQNSFQIEKNVQIMKFFWTKNFISVLGSRLLTVFIDFLQNTGRQQMKYTIVKSRDSRIKS